MPESLQLWGQYGVWHCHVEKLSQVLHEWKEVIIQDVNIVLSIEITLYNHRSILTLPMIPPHTITPPPPHHTIYPVPWRSIEHIFQFLRGYTRTLLSAWLTLNHDSSLKITLCNWRRVQWRWRWAHNSLAALWQAVRIVTVYAVLAQCTQCLH